MSSIHSETTRKDSIVEVEINWSKPCYNDEVTVQSTTTSIVYQIGISGVFQEQPIWTQSEPDCPLAYQIFISEDGIERELTSEEAQIIVFDATDGKF